MSERSGISAPIETLATGYGLVEGPRVDAQGGLYFSDVREGGVYRRAPDGGIETVVPKRKGVGGIALHRDGGVVIAGRNVCHVKDGVSRELFADPRGAPTNDLFTDAQGRVLVGTIRFDPFAPADEREPGELYRLSEGGGVEQLYDDVGMTNGIGFSPDGALLYHCDSIRNQILVHDVDADGATSGRRVFAQAPRGTPDGLAVDEAGGVWIAGHGGGCATRFHPDGSLDRHVEVPATIVTSLCLGGADGRDLYVVSADNRDDAALRGSIFRTRVEIPGLPARLATV